MSKRVEGGPAPLWPETHHPVLRRATRCAGGVLPTVGQSAARPARPAHSKLVALAPETAIHIFAIHDLNIKKRQDSVVTPNLELSHKLQFVVGLGLADVLNQPTN